MARQVNPFFLSPGFGGLCAVIGAAIAYGAATLATRQKAKTDTEQRRQGEVARTWDRFVWVMEHRSEFNPVLTLDLLDQLVTTGDRLGDGDLVAIGRRITTELFRELEPRRSYRHRQPRPSRRILSSTTRKGRDRDVCAHAS